ncbi:MAG TPA: protealysin inhibitor emfourin [Casimicrobiaceae bacterium]
MSLRIDFGIEGGVAAFPGLAKPLTIDCADLPRQDAAKIEALVQRADFFGRRVSARGASMPDARTYTIGVDDGAQCRTLRVEEPIADDAMRELVAELRAHATRLRRAATR